ncbi:MAG TPA: hypothetical protein VFC87_07855 [Perlabentimonas sp.]|nr:hypothetical protein [Bacteroidales bacterium]MDD4672652.1 hypothetical protein [Bacteroidales bacterium]MDY0347987.1 hypothetical protein [Tenuifilaceae bacterium]HZJ74703.1 hypothetical protein [Perlabentimonas sp.]
MTIDLLKIIIPSLLVFLAGYLAVERLLREESNRRRAELNANSRKITTPIRLQAYERIVLFLERISPESILVRVNQPNISSQKFQSILLSTIRSEWEHNLSQQIYLSAKAWGLVKNAKDNVVKLINSSADKVDTKAPAMVLSKEILDGLVDLESHPTSRAIKHLKKEVNEMF